jgi:hypothetical protein
MFEMFEIRREKRSLTGNLFLSICGKNLGRVFLDQGSKRASSGYPCRPQLRTLS